MKKRDGFKMVATDIPAEDFAGLVERAKKNKRTFAGEIRHTLHKSFFPPADVERMAHPSFMDAKLRGKVFGLAMHGVEFLNLPNQGRKAVVDAEALEELFGVFCAITGQEPGTLKPLQEEK